MLFAGSALADSFQFVDSQTNTSLGFWTVHVAGRSFGSTDAMGRIVLNLERGQYQVTLRQGEPVLVARNASLEPQVVWDRLEERGLVAEAGAIRRGEASPGTPQGTALYAEYSHVTGQFYRAGSMVMATSPDAINWTNHTLTSQPADVCPAVPVLPG